MTILRNGYGKHQRRIQISANDEQNIALISIGKRQRAIISVADIEILKEHSFYAHKRNDGQYVARSSQTGAYLHRLILNPEERQEVDHVNAIPLDNTRGNLRLCSTRQNNLAKKTEHVSGFVGIHCTKPHKIVRTVDSYGNFRSETRYAGIYKVKHPDGTLYGKYKTPQEAARERDEIMISEYFHREGEEEIFHPYAFIEWNDDSHFEIQEAVTKMDDWIQTQKEDAMTRNIEIMDKNNWKGTF